MREGKCHDIVSSSIKGGPANWAADLVTIALTRQGVSMLT